MTEVTDSSPVFPNLSAAKRWDAQRIKVIPIWASRRILMQSADLDDAVAFRAPAEQDVGGLDVAVPHIQSVEVLERMQHLPHQQPHLVPRYLAPASWLRSASMPYV